MNDNKIQTALEMLSKVNVAMIEAISAAVNESENEEVIRIISARKATTNEKKQYGEN